MSKQFNATYRWWMWNVSRPFVTHVLKPQYGFALTPESQHFPEKAPFVLVSNHGTFFDPWIVGYYSNHPVALMCNDDAFRASPLSQWYLRSIGAFPKKKGASDFKAMKATLGFLSGNYPVCIFPEGQTTWDGETQLLYKGLERIVKRAACPLVVVHLQGNFLVKPWWAQTTRKGRVLVTVKVIPAEEISRLSHDDLFLRMKSMLYQNDIKDPANLAASFSGTRLTEGLERFVWICPHCRTGDALVMSGNTIRCSSCSTAWDMDPWCRITPQKPDATGLSDLKDWSTWHRQQVLDKIASTAAGSTITQSTNVTLMLCNERNRFESRGAGTLTLTTSELSFVPTDSGHAHLRFPIGEVAFPVIQKKDVFECTHGDTTYRFLFDHHSPMKWVWYVRYMNGYAALEEKGWIE